MRIYRGVSEKKCKKYKISGIPIGENFTNRLSGAKNKGKCIIEMEKTNNFTLDKEQNRIFKRLKISERFYKNNKVIRRFKIKWKNQ